MCVRCIHFACVSVVLLKLMYQARYVGDNVCVLEVSFLPLILWFY
jgi:hypothetical protein